MSTRRRAGRPGRRRPRVRAAAVAVALGLSFAALAVAVRAPVPALVAFDEGTVRVATAITRSEPTLLAALLAWQEASRPVWVNLAVLLVCLWAWRRRGLRTRARWAAVTLLAAWALQAGAKLAVQRPRPVVQDAVAQASGYSFPSGHAANAASAGVLLVVLLWPLLGDRGRVVAPTLVVVAVALTGLHRVLLGVHYPSDVVAGVLLGTAAAAASVAGYRGATPSPAHRGPVG